MLSKALPLLCQVLEWRVRHGIQEFGLGRGAWQQFPRALALQHALRQALLARGPQQAATRITEAAFEVVVGPRQAGDIVAVEQAGPIAPAYLVEVRAKPREGRREVGASAHRVEISPQLRSDEVRAPGWPRRF